MLNRKQYKAIKKYDRQQMEDFVESIYKSGFKAGVDSAQVTDFRIQLSEILQKTKGVGQVLYDRIMKVAKEELEDGSTF